LNEELDDFWGLGLSTCNLTALRYDANDFAGALTGLMHSFGHFRRAGVKHGLEAGFELLAKIAQRRGLNGRAAWCWGVVERIEKDTGTVIAPTMLMLRDQVQLNLTALMPRQSFEDAKSEGKRESVEHAFATVLSNPELAPEPAKPGLFLISSGGG